MRLFGLLGRPNIADLKAKGQIDELIKALHFPDDHNVRFEAASALGEIGDPRCVEPLITALGDSQQRVKEVAIRSLGKIGDPRAIAPLLEALKDTNWEVRGMAAKALGEIGDQRATQALIEALQNDTETVRWYIAQALTHITGQAFGNDVSQWQKWLQENKFRETE